MDRQGLLSPVSGKEGRKEGRKESFLSIMAFE